MMNKYRGYMISYGVRLHQPYVRIKTVSHFPDLSLPLGYRRYSLTLLGCASILSFVELIELMVGILNYFRHKCLKEKTAVEKKRTHIPVKPVRISRVKKTVFRVSKVRSEVV